MCRPLPQLDVQSIRNCKAVGILSGRQPSDWSRASRKESGSGEACATARADSSIAGYPGRTCEHHGFTRSAHRVANWRDFGTSMEVCKLCLRRDSGRTGLLSGLDRLSQDQKQQTHTSSAGGALDGVEASAGAIRRVNAREPRTPGARPLRSADRLSKGHKAIVRCPATTVLLPGHRCAPVPKCHLSARCDWPIPSVFALSSRTILNENCKCA